MSCLWIAVFFMTAKFGSSVGKAVLKSPVYNIKESVCLQFFYQITTPRIVLQISASAPNQADAFTATVTYDQQSNSGSWNQASFLFREGLNQLQFTANKMGITHSWHFVKLDRISLSSAEKCSTTGLQLCFCLFERNGDEWVTFDSYKQSKKRVMV